MSGLEQEPMYLPDDTYDLPRYATHGRPLPPSPYSNPQSLLPDARYAQSPQSQGPMPPPLPPQAQQQHHHHQQQQQQAMTTGMQKPRLSQLMEPVQSLSRSASLSMSGRGKSRDRSQEGYMMVDDVERAFGAVGQPHQPIHQQQRQQSQVSSPTHQQSQQLSSGVYNNPLYPSTLSSLPFDMYQDPQSQTGYLSSPNTAAAHRRSHTMMAANRSAATGNSSRHGPPPASPARQMSHNALGTNPASVDSTSILPYAYQHSPANAYTYDSYAPAPAPQSQAPVSQHQQQMPQQAPQPDRTRPSSATHNPYGMQPGQLSGATHPSTLNSAPPGSYDPSSSDLNLALPSFSLDLGPSTAPALSHNKSFLSQPSSATGATSMPASPMSFSSRQPSTHPQPPPGQGHGQYFGRSNQGTPMQTDSSPAPMQNMMPGGLATGSVVHTPREQKLEPQRERGLVRVRDARDLMPAVRQHPTDRRADPSGNGQYLSPLKCLTSHLSQTYNICNPAFNYESAHNPRRVLTKPSKPAHNEGYDNEDNDYILYVNDFLGGEESTKYLILDILGQGTFGQVVKCQNLKTHEIVAVKVVKNKPAYFNQSMMEVTILELLNKQWDPNDEHHILRLRDTFIHKKHLCLVFELLSSNLYELIKQNQFGGLSTQLVKVFTAQLLDALSVLKEAHLIHCDLKPENILLKSLQSPQIKVIDFGSACHERQTVYTYIQSRFYRSPEVLLGLQYTAAIDMWSLGCIVVELFLGLPLFPGTSEYNQVCRIVEMLGMPPAYMLEMGKSAADFFTHTLDEYGRKKWRLKSLEQYCRDKKTTEQPGKKYFTASTLPEIIKQAPNTNKSNKAVDMEKEANLRLALIDFVQGLLNLNPVERWSPQQAMGHPFITGEKFTKTYVPADVGRSKTSTPAGIPTPASSSSSNKRPYGGLVPSQPQGTRAYQDAAAYNQHLNQHQAYTAQAAQAQNAFRNPYVQPAAAPREDATVDYASQQRHAQAQAQAQAAQAQAQAQAQAAQVAQAQVYASQQSRANTLSMNPSYLPVSSTTGSIPSNPPSSYYSGNRARANTINQMDAVPPQLAKLGHNLSVIESGLGRNSLTPVINREDAMREWERRQQTGGGSARRAAAHAQYPHLDYLQEQAELANSSLSHWNSVGHSSSRPRQTGGAVNYQAPQTPQSSYAGTGYQQNASSYAAAPPSYNDPSQLDDRSGHLQYQAAPTVQITSPPQAYTNNSTGATRYNTSYQAPPAAPYDAYDVRDGIGTLYAPMQPQPYHQPASSSAQVSPRDVQNLSFYGPAVVSSGVTPSTPQRGQYASASSPTVPQTAHAHQSSKDSTSRMSGIDQWQR